MIKLLNEVKLLTENNSKIHVEFDINPISRKFEELMGNI